MKDKIKGTVEEWEKVVDDMKNSYINNKQMEKRLLDYHNPKSGKSILGDIHIELRQNVIALEVLRQELKVIRTDSKLTQQIVAERINTTHNLISRIETGGNDFKIGTLIKLLNVYGYEIKLQKK